MSGTSSSSRASLAKVAGKELQAERHFFCMEEAKGTIFKVVATQTHRIAPTAFLPSLEWQYYVDALQLVLERRSNTSYVSIDDSERVFQSVDLGQPPYRPVSTSPQPVM